MLPTVSISIKSVGAFLIISIKFREGNTTCPSSSIVITSLSSSKLSTEYSTDTKESLAFNISLSFSNSILIPLRISKRELGAITLDT